jgi:hypothetical protein
VKKLLLLSALLGASIVMFLGVFSIVHRPLVVGGIERSLAGKLAYARSLPADLPKLVILAGSNGRYSHRCEVFTERLGLPCVNASVAMGLDLEFQLAQWWPLLHRGDVIYMPLEYAQYRQSRAELQGGLVNAWLVHDHRDYLLAQPLGRIVAAYGSFDLSFLIHGLVEMGLARRGFHRRLAGEASTPQGDSTGHDLHAAQAYGDFVRRMAPERSSVPRQSDALVLIDQFLRRASEAGITVVGGLPTLPDTTVLDPVDLERLRGLYLNAGQYFVALPSRSLYPYACFFDTAYHLHEGCQIDHSRALAELLVDVVASSPAR